MHSGADHWELEYTEEFGDWWDGLTVDEQVDVGAVVSLLEEHGTRLAFPYSSQIRSSAFGAMRELRISHLGEPLRVLYAFDSRRVGVLLLGGNKAGNKRWYISEVRRADALFRRHLEQLEGE